MPRRPLPGGPQERVSPVFVTEGLDSEAFSVRFNQDGSRLAVASRSGAVQIYNVATGQAAAHLNRAVDAHPVKQVCWRPEAPDAPLRTRGILVSASTDGIIRQWHVQSGRCLHEFGEKEKTGQLFCADYSHDGALLVAGGLEELWLFDEETRKQVACLRGGDGVETPGHSNRVYAARFAPNGMVVSAGWDSTVQFWDVRAGHAVRAIFGPEVSGDALDLSADGRRLLTGSHRGHDQLEIWDFDSGRRMEVLPWRRRCADQNIAPCFVFAARFLASGPSGEQRVVAGGSRAGFGGKAGEAKIFEGGAQGGQWRCTATISGFTCLSAHSTQVARDDEMSTLVAVAGSDGHVRIVRMGGPAPEAGADAAALEHCDIQDGSGDEEPEVPNSARWAAADESPAADGKEDDLADEEEHEGIDGPFNDDEPYEAPGTTSWPLFQGL